MENQIAFDDDIIPPPPQFADSPPISEVIDYLVIRKEGSPDASVINYIIEEKDRIINYLNEFQDIKYQIELKVIFENTDDVIMTSDSYITIKLRSDQITKLGFNLVTENDILDAIESFPSQLDHDLLRLRGSGWGINSLKFIKINVAFINTLLAGSYVQLPFKCQSVVNVKNDADHYCLMYSVLAQLYPVDRNPNRVSNYKPYIYKLNLNKITCPTPLNQIPLFEKNNNLTINVYSIKGSGDKRAFYQTYPLYISTHQSNNTCINLLFISDNANKTNSNTKNDRRSK